MPIISKFQASIVTIIPRIPVVDEPVTDETDFDDENAMPVSLNPSIAEVALHFFVAEFVRLS
jgi:hypothetical protein